MSGDGTVKQHSTSWMNYVNELEKPSTLTRTNEKLDDLALHNDAASLPEIMTHSEVNMQGRHWKDKPADSTQQLTLNIKCFHWNSLKPVQSWNTTFSKVGVVLLLLLSSIGSIKHKGS